MNTLAADSLLMLVGPTAAGKKEVGLRVAHVLGADIIFMDSVKVYRGLRIGAARPDPADLRGLHTFLLDVCEPDDTYSVGRYVADAAVAVADIRHRGRIPMFLGGTPLYLQAILRGFFHAPPADAAIRARLELAAREGGVERLHARLVEVDPVAGGRIQPRDLKRIVRALEVFELCGQPISELQAVGTQQPIAGEFRVVGITCPAPMLEARQVQRVDRMLERGLVDEVRTLKQEGRLRGEAAMAIGYREIVDQLEGRCTAEQARAAIITATRQLNRKQRKWYRRFGEIRWVERGPLDTPDSLVERVVGEFSTPAGPTAIPT